MWDERFAAALGALRAVIAKVVDQFLACGLLEPQLPRQAPPGWTRRCQPRCRIARSSFPCPTAPVPRGSSTRDRPHGRRVLSLYGNPLAQPYR